MNDLLNNATYEHLISSFKVTEIELSDTSLYYLKKISIASVYASEQIIKQPDIFIDWLDGVKKNAIFEISIKNIELEVDEIESKKILRLKRHYYLTQIILNDVCLNLSVEEILKQISDLADILINVALDKATSLLSNVHGMPLNSQGDEQPLMILGMGKLGGGELNFSSDIDLILIYAEDGTLTKKSELSYREFYIRVGRLFTKLLNDVTKDGFVYRVDLRLRPWGESGPLVINLAGLESYYQTQGRDWERYALVKARAITGSSQDINALNEIVHPFVYRKYHDFNVFSGLGSLKQQIDKEAKKKNQQQNIKLFSGGIREIEFCIQALQILLGGRHKNLQQTSILAMFEAAKGETFYSLQEIEFLKEAYLFFRLVENRIQMIGDQQTHHLPNDEDTQNRLIVSLNLQDWQSCILQIENHKNKVEEIFNQLFVERVHEPTITDFSTYSHDDWEQYCEALDFKDVELTAKHMTLFFKERIIVGISNKGKNRLNELLPDFLKIVARQAEQESLLNRLTELLLSIARRSVYLELMAMHQPILEKLISLFQKSNWLAEEIIRYPILLESVLIPSQDNVFDRNQCFELLEKELEHVVGDVEMELDVLRVFKRQQLFLIALNEIEGNIKPLEASLYLSQLADILLQASYKISLHSLVQIHGNPSYELEGVKHTAYFAIIAYGKLGGDELHYTSDLDVVFLHDSTGKNQNTDGEKIIGNGQFFVKLAQKITSTSSMLTSSGRLYEIDARLRPNGASGFLVTSIDAYHTYLLEKAWVWEHQALVRAKFVAGDSRFEDKFNAVKCDVLSQIREPKLLADEVKTMREKMLAEFNKDQYFDVKKSKGGMVDIEFMVQYFVLKNANKLSSLSNYSANIAILRYLSEKGFIESSFLELIPCYEYLHEQLHTQVIHQMPQSEPNEKMLENIQSVNQLWEECFQ